MEAKTGTIRHGREVIRFSMLHVRQGMLEIVVHPDSQVTIKAPVVIDADDLMKGLSKRARWIKQQQELFRQFQPKKPKRLCISEERHLYLGKKYSLKIEEKRKERKG